MMSHWLRLLLREPDRLEKTALLASNFQPMKLILYNALRTFDNLKLNNISIE